MLVRINACNFGKKIKMHPDNIAGTTEKRTNGRSNDPNGVRSPTSYSTPNLRADHAPDSADHGSGGDHGGGLVFVPILKSNKASALRHCT